jgi:hypothetical protein
MRATTIFLTENDCRQWLAAAAVKGISRSELLRQALRATTSEILNQKTAGDQKGN